MEHPPGSDRPDPEAPTRRPVLSPDRCSAAPVDPAVAAARTREAMGLLAAGIPLTLLLDLATPLDSAELLAVEKVVIPRRRGDGPRWDLWESQAQQGDPDQGTA